ncbi:translin associated factor X [Arctopsyche grandis]|uniref:translin associated factor X n=1 Tax=Arctopsyche grandis TaxID=121162 RepID=UPI00406D7ADE
MKGEKTILNDDPETKSQQSPILDAFKLYAAELTARHDRHERLVRISRDVTTESKRSIFHLHSLKPEDYEVGIPTVEKRLKVLADIPLKKAASELQTGTMLNIPIVRVLTPAVEEMAEAFCFLHYLKTSSTTEMPTWNDLQNMLTYNEKEDSETSPSLIIRPLDFMLGVLDYTGELMRMCINKSSSSDTEICFTIRTVMQQLYLGFLGLRYHRELNKKMPTFKQSLQKVEDTCYDLKLRNHRG